MDIFVQIYFCDFKLLIKSTQPDEHRTKFIFLKHACVSNAMISFLMFLEQISDIFNSMVD